MLETQARSGSGPGAWDFITRLQAPTDVVVAWQHKWSLALRVLVDLSTAMAGSGARCMSRSELTQVSDLLDAVATAVGDMSAVHAAFRDHGPVDEPQRRVLVARISQSLAVLGEATVATNVLLRAEPVEMPRTWVDTLGDMAATLWHNTLGVVRGTSVAMSRGIVAVILQLNILMALPGVPMAYNALLDLAQPIQSPGSSVSAWVNYFVGAAIGALRTDGNSTVATAHVDVYGRPAIVHASHPRKLMILGKLFTLVRRGTDAIVHWLLGTDNEFVLGAARVPVAYMLYIVLPPIVGIALRCLLPRAFAFFRRVAKWVHRRVRENNKNRHEEVVKAPRIVFQFDAHRQECIATAAPVLSRGVVFNTARACRRAGRSTMATVLI